jgi:hypothetical protein
MYPKRARNCCLYREGQNRSIRIAAHPVWACPKHEQLHAPHKQEYACASESLLSANSSVLSDPPRKRTFPAEGLRHSGNFQRRGNMVPRVFTCSNQCIQRRVASPLRPLILDAMRGIFQGHWLASQQTTRPALAVPQTSSCVPCKILSKRGSLLIRKHNFPAQLCLASRESQALGKFPTAGEHGSQGIHMQQSAHPKKGGLTSTPTDIGCHAWNFPGQA